MSQVVHRAISLPGVDEELAAEIEERVAEFDRDHQWDVARGGPGWVPRVRPVDYGVAIAVNAVIVIWLVLVLMVG
jgi:hypothetical protein